MGACEYCRVDWLLLSVRLLCAVLLLRVRWSVLCHLACVPAYSVRQSYGLIYIHRILLAGSCRYFSNAAQHTQ